MPDDSGSPEAPHTSGAHVCVVGHGAAGRLHLRLLGNLGFALSVVDPSAVAPPPGVPAFDRIHAAVRHRAVDIWSVCSPTATHVDTVAAILETDPKARLLVEKPLCRTWEIPRITALLASHPEARLVTMDQYRHTTSMALLRSMLRELAPQHPLRAVRVGFGKDRRDDIAAGRFVDRDHGVFGYEWLHMLALLREALPQESFDAYLAASPEPDHLRVASDPELVSAAAHEVAEAGGVAVELYSTVVGPAARGQVPMPGWFDLPVTADESRQRYVEVDAGLIRFGLTLDPVTLPQGTRLPRNTHWLTATGPDLRREWFVHDSPLDTALRWSIAALLSPSGPPALDLRGVSRIGLLAEAARSSRTPSVPSRLPADTPSIRL
ncbi:ABC transporter ATP-binding protein [Streptomyces caeruleatus]|uniref:ABC transporter ATP-binding protein n=1 Tax=Streptomyces caeruleatus TaxID=661399 RepID=A0A101TFN8_9ACTN|nr:ABC transporter ATP-binding protein [Streptomyces caeruleatus]